MAIITGGGRGIGRAIARVLAQAGAKVAVAARSRDQLDETVALINQQGGQAISFPLDVTDQAAIEAMLADTERQFGPVDLLVNNAGINFGLEPIWELPADQWWQVVEVNLRGPFLCARAVLPGMIARRRGRIINVSSGIGLAPSASYSAYSVSKAALFRLTDCLAEMTAPYNVPVFAISPGLVRTAMADDIPFYKDTPADEWVPAERSGELCAFLATGQADRLSGRYIHVTDDVQQMIQQADQIIEQDLHVLRLRVDPA